LSVTPESSTAKAAAGSKASQATRNLRKDAMPALAAISPHFASLPAFATRRERG
jgi:hypothetical protein